jgi:extradiol dioxygenase family protein
MTTRLAAHGVKYRGRFAGSVWDYHLCFLRDPNGYFIEIQQFLDPAWPGP